MKFGTSNNTLAQVALSFSPEKCFHYTSRTVGYQPKATTLACVLVLMVTLKLISEYLTPTHSSLLIIEHK